MYRIMIPAIALFVVTPLIAYAAFFLKSSLPGWSLIAIIAGLAVVYLISSYMHSSRDGELFSNALKPWIIGSVALMLLYLLI